MTEEITIRCEFDVTWLSEVYFWSDSKQVGKNTWFFGMKRLKVERVDYLAVFVHCVGLTDYEEYRAKSKFHIINQLNNREHYNWEFITFYSRRGPAWGNNQFLDWNSFVNPSNGHVVNNRVAIETTISISSLVPMPLTHLCGKIELTDCVITLPPLSHFCSSKRYRAFSTILAEKSGFFAKELKTKKEIEVTDDVSLLMNLLHNTENSISDQTVNTLLNLTVKYECPVEIQQCEKYIIESTTITMIQKLKYADQHGLDRLKKSCLSQLTSRDQVKRLMNDKKYETLSNAIRLEMMEHVFKFDEKNETAVKQEDYIINGKVRDFRKPRGWLTDVRLDVNGEIFHVSKQILRVVSSVFDDLFKKNESKEQFIIKDALLPISIKNLESNDFDEFLQMIYQPTNYVTNSNYIPLMELSYQFKVNFILRKCEIFVIKNSNIIDKMIYASKYEMDELMKHVASQVNSSDELDQLSRLTRFELVSDKVIGMITRRLLKSKQQMGIGRQFTKLGLNDSSCKSARN